MRTVPLADSSGTLPLRASKNPVLGVFRHHCGELASVHQPNGTRKHMRYLICDRCKTDQAAGKEYQAEIKANTYATIEALQASENAALTANDANVIDGAVLAGGLDGVLRAYDTQTGKIIWQFKTAK